MQVLHEMKSAHYPHDHVHDFHRSLIMLVHIVFVTSPGDTFSSSPKETTALPRESTSKLQHCHSLINQSENRVRNGN